MTRYNLHLINIDPQLNLISKSKDIDEVFRFIHNGGSTGRKFKDLEKYSVVEIKQYDIVVEVSESSKKWHCFVGFFLANKFGMRNYCYPKNNRRMFEWMPT